MDTLTLQVKNRYKEVAEKIVEQMKRGENQGSFALHHDPQPLTTRERYDAADEVHNQTGVKVGLSSVYHHGNQIGEYSWETI